MAPSFAYASLIAAAVICLAVPSATEGVYPVGDYESHEYTPRGSYHPAFANRTHTLGTRPETSRRVYHPSFNGRGILLWSLGRSGTSAFWDSMRSWVRGGGMDLNVLCGKKEGFLSEHLNRLRLHRSACSTRTASDFRCAPACLLTGHNLDFSHSFRASCYF